MPITIIAMKLATAPIAVPSALVSLPTDPNSWLPMVPGGPCGTRPRRATKFISRSNCSVTTIRRASNCAAIVVPANQNTQPRKPKPSTITRTRRHGRGIGSQRPR